MKKIHLLSLVILVIIFTFCGCSFKNSNKNIVVNEQEIENTMFYNKITNSINKEYLHLVFADDFEVQYVSVKLPEEFDEVKKSLLESKVIIEKCKDEKILIDKEASIKKANTEFNTLKKDESQNQYYFVLTKKLSEYEISENDYMSMLHEQAYYKYNRQSLNAFFIEKLYNPNDRRDITTQYNEYIETLLK